MKAPAKAAAPARTKASAAAYAAARDLLGDPTDGEKLCDPPTAQSPRENT
ncbi:MULTISPECIES: hypothetical protein [Rhodopseudomonas]|nr:MULTISPECIES: hypothetical protein [Rhodopseudomonas]